MISSHVGTQALQCSQKQKSANELSQHYLSEFAGLAFPHVKLEVQIEYNIGGRDSPSFHLLQKSPSCLLSSITRGISFFFSFAKTECCFLSVVKVRLLNSFVYRTIGCEILL